MVPMPKTKDPLASIDKSLTQNIKIWVASLENLRVLLAHPKMKGEHLNHYVDRKIREDAAELKLELPY